jgi:hypothetical protein
VSGNNHNRPPRQGRGPRSVLHRKAVCSPFPATLAGEAGAKTCRVLSGCVGSVAGGISGRVRL